MKPINYFSAAILVLLISSLMIFGQDEPSKESLNTHPATLSCSELPALIESIDETMGTRQGLLVAQHLLDSTLQVFKGKKYTSFDSACAMHLAKLHFLKERNEKRLFPRREGKIDTAKKWLNAGLQIAKPYAPNGNHIIGELYMSLGTQFKQAEIYDSAIYYYEILIDHLSQNSSPTENERIQFVKACNNLGGAYQDIGQIRYAIPLYEKADSTLSFIPIESILKTSSAIYSNWGNANFDLGEFERSQVILNKNKELLENFYPTTA
ncbi:MAG: hypothetical protein AAFY76_05780, partial [Cyanobacteria bacterium J06649_11]